MPTVESEVQCPLCQGVCRELLDCNSGTADYYCENCGYATDTRHTPKQLIKKLPRQLRPFLKKARFTEDHNSSFTGEFVWIPAGVEVATRFSVLPVAVKGGLKWRRCEIEKVPDEEQKNYPMENGKGNYMYRSSSLSADYDSFSEAMSASRDEHLARIIKEGRPRFSLLGGKQ